MSGGGGGNMSAMVAKMMMYPASNQSLQQLGNFSDGVKYTWMIWLIGVLLTAIVGNITVLMGSIKYKAIQLDKVTTTLIQHTAVSDLLLILTTLPTLISLMSDSLFYSKDVCTAVSWVNGFLVRSSCLMVAALNISKIASLFRPIHSIAWSSAIGHRIAAAAWVSAGALIGFKVYIARDSFMMFNPKMLRCHPKFNENEHWILINVESFMSKLVPTAVVILSTGCLICLLHRRVRKYTQLDQDATSNATRSLSKQAIVTVVAVAVVFVVSYGPLYGMIVYRLATGANMRGTAYMNVLRGFNYIVYLNCAGNFFIYLATVRSFNSFIVSKLKFRSWSSLNKTDEIDMDEL